MKEEYTIDLLIQKILTDDKQYDLSKIITAYEFAAKAHEGQFRSSGQPYIIHPLAVAYILLEWIPIRFVLQCCMTLLKIRLSLLMK